MTEQVIVITSGLQMSIQEVEVKDGLLLDGLKKIVGGWIEVVRPRRLEHPLCMVCNEEGLLLGLPLNAVGSYLYGSDKHGNPIVGDIAILQEGIRNGEPDIEGLPDGVIQDVLSQLKKGFPQLKEAAYDVNS